MGAGAIGEIGRRKRWDDDWLGKKDSSMAGENNRSRMKRNSCKRIWQLDGWKKPKLGKPDNKPNHSNRSNEGNIYPPAKAVKGWTSVVIHTISRRERI
jgi:hypothetical protein